MVITNQKPITDAQKMDRIEDKNNTKENHQTMRDKLKEEEKNEELQKQPKSK